MLKRSLKILVMVLLCLASQTQAQPGGLDRLVTLRYENAPLESVLKKLGSAYGLKFSYVNNLIPLQQKVSIHVKNQALKDVLDALFKNTQVSYQLIGDQIVLKYEPNKASSMLEVPEPTEASRVSRIELEQIRNRNLPIPGVRDQSRVLIPIKEQLPYQPTMRDQRRFLWVNQYIEKLQMLFQSLAPQNTASLDSLASKTFAGSDHVSPLADSILNDPYWDYAEKDWQLTFVTPVGTNGAASLQTVNRLSVNLLAGAAAGLKGTEFGGFVNMETDYVHGAQLAGFANLVQKEVTGVQLAGFANLSGGQTKGVQGAGFANVALRPSQVIQAAGFANVVVGHNLGSQFAGFANVATGDVKGVQVAGFFNHARRVKGSQIGLINVADSVSGVSIGLLSFVKKGYRRLEVWGSEALYGNVAFKMGTRKFYNILAAGVQPVSGHYRWAVGYGMGTEQPLSHGRVLNLDALSYHVNENEAWTKRLNLLNQVKVTLGVRLSGHVYLFAGPTFNVLVSQFYDPEKNRYGSELAPWRFYNQTSGGLTHGKRPTNVQMWVGVNAGLRF